MMIWEFPVLRELGGALHPRDLIGPYRLNPIVWGEGGVNYMRLDSLKKTRGKLTHV